MRKNLTEIVFILDRSGSMRGLEKDTIGGYNGMIDKQKKEEGEALVTTVLFDDRIEVPYDRVPLGDLPEMTEKEYYVRGCTALLDAVGTSVERIATIHKYAREEDRPEHTIFIITTDGLENASRRFTYDQVKRLITRQQEESGWEFIFLGANIDAVKAAGDIGIRRERAVNYRCDPVGTKLNYEAMDKAVHSVRMGEELDDSWREELDEDFLLRQ
ncbi:MAG: VWA domain-containing protein [Lachnospiraceae bacterium]|nr:VWA domain-containing protein [Lachnospiraceae bacterium]MBQ3973090.1 VWA domain-containing protein [Lachnospiraceae bacterium]MBQ4304589.1 VWA domain-containing protein [Lachnospiraceae bacterium]